MKPCRHTFTLHKTTHSHRHSQLSFHFCRERLLQLFHFVSVEKPRKPKNPGKRWSSAGRGEEKRYKLDRIRMIALMLLLLIMMMMTMRNSHFHNVSISLTPILLVPPKQSHSCLQSVHMSKQGGSWAFFFEKEKNHFKSYFYYAWNNTMSTFTWAINGRLCLALRQWV